MYRYDFQVDSSTLRLPTLKELVGLTTSLSNQDSTEDFTLSPATNPIADTTIVIDAIPDETDDDGYQKNRVDDSELLGEVKNVSDSDQTLLKSTIEKEIFDNDILGSEEIRRRSSSSSFVNRVGTRVEGSTKGDEDISKNGERLRRVEVPVKILGDGDDEEIAELVILRVPENKFNSAILKPVFRVKIVDHDSVKDGKVLEGVEKVPKSKISPESSLENDVSDNFSVSLDKNRQINSPTFPSPDKELANDSGTVRNRPRNRQRIVKARRRTRPLASDNSDEQIYDTRANDSKSFRAQGVRRTSRRRETTNETSSSPTTAVPEPLESSSTTVRATTMRGNYSGLFTASNVTRGFYVTRNLDEESSSISDTLFTDIVESTLVSSALTNDILDDRTPEMYSTTPEMNLVTQMNDLTTQKTDFTAQTIDSETTNLGSTTQIEGIILSLAEKMDPSAEELSTVESTTLMDSESPLRIRNENELTDDQELTSRKPETVTPNYISTLEADFTESSTPTAVATDENRIREPEATTFRPWATRPTIMTFPTASMDLSTTEYPPEASTAYDDKNTITRYEETSGDESETLKASENNHWNSSMILETKTTIVPGITGYMQEQEATGFETGSSEMENVPVSRNNSGENHPTTISLKRKSEVQKATVPLATTRADKATTPSSTESSSRRTTNISRQATTYRGALNRGGARYTVSQRSISSTEPSRETRNSSRKSTKSFASDVGRNKLTNERASSIAISASSTESYDKATRNGVNGKSRRLSSNFESEALTPPNARSSSRGRKVARKRTKVSEIDKTRSRISDPTEATIINSAGTGARDKTVDNSTDGGTSRSTTRVDRGGVSRPGNSISSAGDYSQAQETRGSFGIPETGSSAFAEGYPSSSSVTEAYQRTVNNAIGNSTYSTTNFVEETQSHSVTPEPSLKDDVLLKTTESLKVFKADGNASEENGSPATILTTSEAYYTQSTIEQVTDVSGNSESSTGNIFSYTLPFSTKSLEKLEPTKDPSKRNGLSPTVLSVGSNDRNADQTTMTSEFDFPTPEKSTGSEYPDSLEPIQETTRSFATENSVLNLTRESTTTSESANTYDETNPQAFTTLVYDPTTYSSGRKSTPMKIDTILPTTEAYEKITETTDSVNTIVTAGIFESEENRTESREIYETTASHDKTFIPWLYAQRNDDSDQRKTDSPNIMGDATMDIKLEYPASTPGPYMNTDGGETLTNTDDYVTKTNDQTESNPEEKFTGEITEFPISTSDVSTEPNEFSTATAATTIYERSMDTWIHNSLAEEKILSSSLEPVSPSNAITNDTRSTSPIYEKYTSSTTEPSINSETSITQRQTKRPRGRVRFTSFAGSSDDENENNRRAIKQVVVRRRLAKDRQRNATTTEPNLIEADEKNSNIIPAQIKNVRVKNKNLENERIHTEDESIEAIKKEDDVEADPKNPINSGNKLDASFPEGKAESPKSTRRRIVVYRGRPRSETIVTTPSTTTTTVQSLSTPSDDFNKDKPKRIRKWRKRLVLKRSRANTEEDDQTIAETGDFRRAFIADELVPDFLHEHDESLETSKPENTGEEGNVFKSSGNFLRKPGSLVRNEALNRLRSKPTSTPVPTTSSPTKDSTFLKSQSVESSFETKTDDQSVRAQEFAVTLADPPAIPSSLTPGRVALRKSGTTRKISTTIAPRTEAPRTTPIVRRRQNRPRNENSRVIESPVRPRRPAIIDYDYYVDDEIRIVLKPELKDKLFVTRKGGIRCLDQGNFAHPTSCKKFITCARMVNGQVIGTEYTCPDKLSFDPVGGICNWSAGLGCEDKSKSN